MVREMIMLGYPRLSMVKPALVQNQLKQRYSSRSYIIEFSVKISTV